MLRSEHVIARLSRGRILPYRLAHDDPHVLEVAHELDTTGPPTEEELEILRDLRARTEASRRRPGS